MPTPAQPAGSSRAGAFLTGRLVWPAALLALLVAPWLIDNPFALLLLSATGVTFLAALGLDLVMGFAGQVSLGHAALLGVGAYTSAILTLKLGLPFAAGFLAAGLASGLVGLLLGIPSLRLAGPYLAMATMAFNLVVQRLLINWSELTGGPDGLPGLPPAAIGPVVFDRRTSLYLIAAVALGGLLIARNLARSRHGRALLAMRENELAASCLGVNLYRAKLLAFACSAVYAGFAGSLFAHLYGFISPISFGLETSLELLLAVLLGGPGTLTWPLAGALVVTVLPQLPALQSLQDFRLFAYGAILLASVIVMRRGFAGLVPTRHRPGGARVTAADGAPPLGPLALPPTAETPLLVLRGVRRRFGGVVALDGLDLAVVAGTVHGLIGPNGSGKTTALNVISGVYRPDAGEVLLDGRPVGGLSPNRLAKLGVARTFQNLRLFGELTVLENVQVGQHRWHRPPLLASLLGLPAARAQEAAAARAAALLAAWLGLGDVLHQPALDLPHGRQRRLELARALAARPRLLLLDEPAAGLSGTEIAELRTLIEQARAAGTTVLLVEHHLELVLDLCDRVTVLDRGRVIAEGPPAAVRADPRVAEAYLGQRRADAAP